MNTEDFIKKHNLIFSYEQFVRAVEEFECEMQKGLEGQEGSLKMIPAYITEYQKLESQKVVSVDMGGTNLRISLMQIQDDGSIKTERANTYPMPGTEKKLERNEFFDIFAGYLLPFLKDTVRIGLCFSFPCEIQPDLDGKILFFNKEVRINDCEGESLAANLQSALLRVGFDKKIKLAVINDTVGALLGAKAQAAERPFGGFIGFILGTGTNTCYAEANVNVGKNSYLKARSGTSLINLESGAYAKIPRTEVDISFDQKTAMPGTQQLEKLISGAYLGGLLLEYLKFAAKDGCFGDETSKRILELKELTSIDADKFYGDAFGTNTLARLTESMSDKRAVYRIIDAFFDRAAFVTAINLTAILRKSGKASDELRPVCISAEGSTIRKCRVLNSKSIYYMTDFAQKKMGLCFEFVYAENTTLTGAAYAALLL